jgi:hypothetical protein
MIEDEPRHRIRYVNGGRTSLGVGPCKGSRAGPSTQRRSDAEVAILPLPFDTRFVPRLSCGERKA